MKKKIASKNNEKQTTMRKIYNSYTSTKHAVVKSYAESCSSATLLCVCVCVFVLNERTKERYLVSFLFACIFFSIALCSCCYCSFNYITRSNQKHNNNKQTSNET